MEPVTHICCYCGGTADAETSTDTFIETPDPSAALRGYAKGFKARLCQPCAALRRYGERSTLETILGAAFCNGYTDEVLAEVGRLVRPLHEHDRRYAAHGPREPWSHVDANNLKVAALATKLPTLPPPRVPHSTHRACGVCGVAAAAVWSPAPALNGYPNCLECDESGCVTGPTSEWKRLRAIFPGLTGSYWIESVIAPYRDLAAADASLPIAGLPTRFGYLDTDDLDRLKAFLVREFRYACPPEWVAQYRRPEPAPAPQTATRFTAVGV